MNQAWSMPMDIPMGSSTLDGQIQHQSQQGNAFNSPEGIFMGVDNPGKYFSTVAFPFMGQPRKSHGRCAFPDTYLMLEMLMPMFATGNVPM